MEHYVYVFLDPRKPGQYHYSGYDFNYEPYYVGKGTGKRKDKHFFEFHLTKDSNKIKTNKIKKILSEGYNPKEFVVVYPSLSEEEALQKEILLIFEIGRSCFKGGPLTNLTAGGEGCSRPSPNKGKTLEEIHGVEWTAEYKELMSKNRLGANNPMFGKTGCPGKPVNQLSLNNQLIKVWGSIREASEALKIPYGRISKCLSPKDKTKQSGGFKWEYAHKINPKNNESDKRFFQYEITFPDGHIETVTNLSELARQQGLSDSFFPMVARRGHKTWKCKKIHCG